MANPGRGYVHSEGTAGNQALVPKVRSAAKFYDSFEMEGGKAMVVLAEVSGKGLSAAMAAAVTRSHIRAAARRLGDPAKALRETNQNLVGNVRNGMVVSCFCGILDLSSHALSYANAGHVPPFIVSSDGFVDTLVGGAIAMGALDHIDLEMEGWMIDPGYVLVICTTASSRWRTGTVRGSGQRAR